CDNEIGNELLRQMENAAHNEWNPQNFRDGDDVSIEDINRAYNELKAFVNNKLDSLSKVDSSKKINFIGLEEFLSIPEDLLEKENDFESNGENRNNNIGATTKDLTDDETGMQTTYFDPIIIKPTISEK